MEQDAIRLECLKLALRPNLSPGDVVIGAKVYEEYVTGTTQAPPKGGSKKVNPLA